ASARRVPLMSTAPQPLDKIDPILAWKPWEPDAKQPWDLKWAGHLYRRAGFGATHEELLNAVHNGLSTTMKSLFEGDPQRAARDRALAKEGVVVARKGDVLDLRGWWVERMLQSGQPLREKMTLFWHKHFATSLSKVQSTALMHRQNELLRRHALGKFEPLLLDVSKDPAMLVWVDSNRKVAGKPNENYARELMELFSLGVGNYVEKDVREAARAFTGWHTDGKQFSFAAALHDPEEKTVLGETGPWDGGDVV